MKKKALLRSLLLLLGSFVFAIQYQNCAKFQPLAKANSSNGNSLCSQIGAWALLPCTNSLPVICSPKDSKACQIEGIDGRRYCSEDGTSYGLCEVLSCKSGEYRNGSNCLPQKCQPGTPQTCSGDHGSGNKTCNSLGSDYGSCVLEACDQGYILQSGACVPDQPICTPGAKQSCAENHGSGQVTCSGDGKSYGPCLLTACDSTYHLDSGACVANQCVPNSPRGCSGDHGTGQQICNSIGSGYGSCNLDSCNQGFHLSQGLCVANICEPNQYQPCSVQNGQGRQLCNSDGSAVSSCEMTSCNSGYNPQNGTCVLNICTPNETQPCTLSGASAAQKSCNSSGTAWLTCNPSQCNFGYHLENGSCVQNICTPGQSGYACPVPNGTGSATCNAQGTALLTCQTISCNSQYRLVNGSCLQACPTGQFYDSSGTCQTMFVNVQTQGYSGLCTSYDAKAYETLIGNFSSCGVGTDNPGSSPPCQVSWNVGGSCNSFDETKRVELAFADGTRFCANFRFQMVSGDSSLLSGNFEQTPCP